MASLEQNRHGIHNLHPPHHHKNNNVLIKASKDSVKAISRLQSTLVMKLFTIGFLSSDAYWDCNRFLFLN